MTYEELVKELRKNYGELDTSGVKEHVAIQFNIKGEGEGALYVEISDGKADVQPYEYYDNDAILTTTAEVALKLSMKKADLKECYDNETVKVWGDLDKILRVYGDLRIAVKKAPEEKPANEVSAADTEPEEAPKKKKS